MRRVWPWLLLCVSCERGSSGAYAKRIAEPSELIGGKAAIGGIGDWLMGNQSIRVVVQAQGSSRGLGVFGGGIIDADLERTPSSRGRGGNDYFGEMFPVFFVQGLEVRDRQDPNTGHAIHAVEIVRDGAAGGPAVLRVHATGGDLLAALSQSVRLAMPENLRFETDYIVRAGTRHIELVTRIINTGSTALDLSGQGLAALLAQSTGRVLKGMPMGDVLLFGAGNRVFAPGAVSRPGGKKLIGFDLRFSLAESEATYAAAWGASPTTDLALKGVVAEFLATAGPGVSYGLALPDDEQNYVWQHRGLYQLDAEAPVSQHALLVPFVVDTFTGAYAALPPRTLAPQGESPGDSFEYRRYFIVGTGDVASIRDELYAIRGTATGRFAGRVLNTTGDPAPGASVHVFDARGRPFSQVSVDAQGYFSCKLEPGSYAYRVTGDGRRPYPESAVGFDIVARKEVYRVVEIPPPAELAVLVRDETGRAVPARVTVVGHYGAEHDAEDPDVFLFDLSLGETRRATDLSTPNPPAQRHYIEATLYGTGLVRGPIRPPACSDASCAYDVYVSRGPEYDLSIVRGVQLQPGERRELSAVLHRVVDTRDYISADFNVHSANSMDSAAPLERQLIAAAAEGLEFVVLTDHNIVSDPRPAIASLGLEDFVGGVVGVELTTLESGHFNGFPLRYDADARRAKGPSFDWAQYRPQELFDGLRSLGSLGAGHTIVQVNHPRDGMQGYFSQFGINPYTAVSESPNATNQSIPASFSRDFDALEVLSGTHTERLHAFVLPESVPNDVLVNVQDRCAFYPGQVDDWLNLLNAGLTPTATANSDSHGREGALGSARTYLYLPRDSQAPPRDRHPGDVSTRELAQAIKDHRAVVTNGPFLSMTVDTETAELYDPPCSSFETEPDCRASSCEWNPGARVCVSPVAHWGIGDTVRFLRSNAGREVAVWFTLRSPAWIRVDRIVVYANGRPVQTLSVCNPDKVRLGLCDFGTLPDGRDIDDATRIPWRHVFDVDTVLVAEAYGDDSLFPIAVADEEPPPSFEQFLQGLVGSTSPVAEPGVTAPNPIHPVTPYALTNPIWLDIDADGQFAPPGNFPGPGPVSTVGCPPPF